MPFLGGCPDTKNVTTTINRDGSCVRTIGNFDPREFKGIDSIKHDIPIPIDESWKLVAIDDSAAVLKKGFGSVAELDALYDSDESEIKMYKRKVTLDKKFRWFHTFFQYRESYDGLLTEIPITEYMTLQEADVFKSSNPEDHPMLVKLEEKSQNSLSDNIEERFGYWLHDNIYSLAFNDIIEIADSLKILDYRNVDVKALKDTVKKIIENESKKIINFDFEDDLDMVDLAKLIGSQVHLDSVSKIKLSGHVENAKLDERYENWLLADIANGHNNQVILPGQLIDTNAERINGDTLVWHMNSIKFIDADYTMFAESRVTNNWAFLVSGFILAVAIMIPFIKRRKD